MQKQSAPFLTKHKFAHLQKQSAPPLTKHKFAYFFVEGIFFGIFHFFARNVKMGLSCIVTLFWRHLIHPFLHITTRARARARSRRPRQLVVKVEAKVIEEAKMVSSKSLSILSRLIFPGWAWNLGLEAYTRTFENTSAFLLTREKCSGPMEILK